MDALFSSITSTIMTICIGLGSVGMAVAVGSMAAGKIMSSPKWTGRATNAFIGGAIGLGAGVLYPAVVNIGSRFTGGNATAAVVRPAGALVDLLIVNAQHVAVNVLAVIGA